MLASANDLGRSQMGLRDRSSSSEVTVIRSPECGDDVPGYCNFRFKTASRLSMQSHGVGKDLDRTLLPHGPLGIPNIESCPLRTTLSPPFPLRSLVSQYVPPTPNLFHKPYPSPQFSPLSPLYAFPSPILHLKFQPNKNQLIKVTNL